LSRELNRNVFRCLLKVSSVTSLERSATGKLFHASGPCSTCRSIAGTPRPQLSIDICCPCQRASAQHQTSRTPLLLTTDETDGRTDTRPSHIPCCACGQHEYVTFCNTLCASCNTILPHCIANLSEITWQKMQNIIKILELHLC